MSDFHEYKAQKEAFVSGLEGTTVSEITLVLLVMPASSFFTACVRAHVPRHARLANFVVDFSFSIIPALIAFTFTEWTPALLTLLLVGALAVDASCRCDICSTELLGRDQTCRLQRVRIQGSAVAQQ